MNCPNCGKENEDNQKFCTSCGCKILEIENSEDEENNSTEPKSNKINKKGIIIAITSIIIIAIIVLMFFIFKSNTAEISKYKSIAPIEQSIMENMSGRSALDLLIQQDNDLTEYINKHPKCKIDNLFEVFYKNLYAFAGSELEFNSKLSDNGDEENAKNGIEYKYEQSSKGENDITIGRIIKPKTDLFVMANDGEGDTEAIINYDYLIKYSSNLTPSWKDFLQLKQKEYRDLYGYTYYTDGYPPIQSIIINRYLEETKFIKQHPDFALNNRLQNNIQVYAGDITGRLDVLDLIFDYDENGNPKLSNNIKTAYEKFISEADKNTNEYKYINGLYNALKNNNFKHSVELYKSLYDITGNKNYLDMYNEQKQQADEQQAKDNCKKINYNGYTSDNCETVSMYSDEERKNAYKFAYKINTVFQSEDIEELANMIYYPITIGKIQLKNKQEFLNSDKQLIFNERIKQATKNKAIFDNYQGFMFGNGEIWFSKVGNGDFLITAINILE